MAREIPKKGVPYFYTDDSQRGRNRFPLFSSSHDVKSSKMLAGGTPSLTLRTAIINLAIHRFSYILGALSSGVDFAA